MTTSQIPPRNSAQRSQAEALDLFAEDQSHSDHKGPFETLPPNWLGLEIDHRRLFEAAQDGWLRPKSSAFVLGHECFVADPNRLQKPHLIRIRIVFDSQKFPRFHDLHSHQATAENTLDLHGDNPNVVVWPAPIPLYAITKMKVSSPDEETQLRAMATQFSNVSLPSVDIEIGDAPVGLTPFASSDITNESPIKLPKCLDATQGSMAMAIWGVPHIQPWMDALQSALGLDAERATAIMTHLDAQWLKFPWLEQQQSPAEDANYRLWKAAISTMGSPSVKGKSPSQVAELIAQNTDHMDRFATIDNWLRKTRRIADAEESISKDSHGAGLAIQLALLRPDPIDFRTWTAEHSCMSPATLWAGAMLCGWRHGYRALDKQFRGEAILQEYLSTRALVASWERSHTDLLPALHQEKLNQQRQSGCFALNWGDRPILRKKWKSRAKWFVADLSEPTTEKAARDVARQRGWDCLKWRVTLKDCLVPLSGDGKIEIDAAASSMCVHQNVDLALPSDAEFIEAFDKNEFKRELASKPGLVEDPPNWGKPQAEDIPGLIYEPNFLTNEEEKFLMAHIDEEKWSMVLKRRVQQYGWRYDYKKRQLDSSMYLGALPDWTNELVQRLVEEGYMREKPNQLIVNEYCCDQGISAHTDHVDNFAEPVVTISLLETWNMVFRLRNSKKRIEKPLEHGSIAVFTGDVRYRWTHEIPNRKFERTSTEGKRTARKRRVSLTFRKTQTDVRDLLEYR